MLRDVFRLQLDLLGARSELAASLVGSWLLNRSSPQGDGNQPVMTFPGFLASDTTLLRLNGFLNANGFIAESWGQGRNLGPQKDSWATHLEKLKDALSDRIRQLAETHDKPVALIGQSLGGVHARELALQMPDYVDRVIMLGSPTFHPYMQAEHNRAVSLVGDWLTRRSHAEIAGRTGLLHWDADAPPLPCISFHSPIDGVVDESSSVIPTYIVEQSQSPAARENVRVFSTHIGMSVNPWVLLAIADRLVQNRDHWENFDPSRYFPDSLGWASQCLFPAQEKTRRRSSFDALLERA